MEQPAVESEAAPDAKAADQAKAAADTTAASAPPAAAAPAESGDATARSDKGGAPADPRDTKLRGNKKENAAKS